MPQLLIYLLKVNIALLLFCMGYYFILRRLTFYTLNRVYLITAILFSSLYPQINFNSVIERHEKLVKPLQVIVIELNTPALNFTKPVEQTNYWQWLVIVFWAGVVFMTLRLAVQFWSLCKVYRRSKPAQIYDYNVRVINEEANPFSFWQSIYVNPTQHAPQELHSIIVHEQVHVQQWHTLDILLAELSLVFYWFNPGVWLMKKAVAENLEFITDRKILQQGVDAKSYQYSLLYASFNTSPNAIVNHFNISTIKKRIMMMNSKNSSPFSLTRYGFIAPAVLVLLLAFGTSKAAFIKKGISSAKSVTSKVMAIADVNSSKKTGEKTTTPTVKANSNNISLLAVNKAVSIKGINNTNIRKPDISFDVDTPKYKANFKVKFNGTDSAYYVVNGIHTPANKLTNINPDDIVSINVIGSPSADKIFGKEAKNGAVVVVTKDGEKTVLTKQLLQKIATVRNKGTLSTTGIISVKPIKGSQNSISISSVADSNSKPLKGTLQTVTVTGTGERISKVNVNSQTFTATPANGRVKLKGLSENADPLIIIDEKEATPNDFNNLNPNEIKAVHVLKDTSATNTYGDKGKKGVIKIYTKAAKN
jgi:hypothetical protein